MGNDETSVKTKMIKWKNALSAKNASQQFMEKVSSLSDPLYVWKA